MLCQNALCVQTHNMYRSAVAIDARTPAPSTFLVWPLATRSLGVVTPPPAQCPSVLGMGNATFATGILLTP
eukprot:1142260-Pelagomonas_calceolata.AAC.5